MRDMRKDEVRERVERRVIHYNDPSKPAICLEGRDTRFGLRGGGWAAAGNR